MKILNGNEIASYIKDRQLKNTRSLTQSTGLVPKLAIIQVKDDQVINTYVRLKQEYGRDIGVEVDLHRVKQTEAADLIKKLNTDDSVHGIIIQLPLKDISETERLTNLVKASKDVDALAQNTEFEPATPVAILWLLAGYNIDLNRKKVAIIGKGKLVGLPLERMLKESGVSVRSADKSTSDLSQITREADVIITATGNPALIHPEMIKVGAVIVDAGVATEEGKTVGDLAPAVYDREDLTITPSKGGVGPLTVCSLFENVILAATNKSKQ